MPELPLRDVRVVDLTRNVAGPYAAMILGELGAEVVKVERPGRGDDAREWGPPFWGGESSIFLALNRNKRSLALDLGRPEAKPVLERLVAGSDVLLESFRPGVVERLGYGYEWALERNPRLIYCSVTGYGDQGPLRERPGYDPLLQAFAGIMSVTGEAGRPPVRVGVSLVDMGTGMWAALAVTAALLQRGREGRGQRIVVSLYETALAWMAYHLAGYWASGVTPGRQGSGTEMIVPYQAFATADGWLVIAAGNDALFERLCRELGHPGWACDPRFARNPDRVRHRAELVGRIEAVTRGWETERLAERLTRAGVPCSPIRDTAQVAGDAQAEALGIFQALSRAGVGELGSVGMPFLLDGERPRLRRPPPWLGEHSREVLAELGFGPEEVEALVATMGGQDGADDQG
ncbi:MAG TPA: CoA transferase [Candidatus Dormibacteraeota bacterium]|nr:CoA transferase [Candidatus Dormibacteraeota bacterium]